MSCVVGARPNFIKIAPLVREFRASGNWDVRLIHTGQHHSPEMSQAFFDDLEIPPPEVNLDIRGGTPTQQTAAMLTAFEPEFTQHRPDVLVVVGDVTSTLSAALSAVRQGIPIAHVEAGLRSGDRSMPEEINRILTDAISDYLFVTERNAMGTLRREGVPAHKIVFAGNVMIDTLLRFRDRASRSDILERCGVEPGAYAVATVHRVSNVDEPVRLESLARMLNELSREVPVVFPVHPRTRQRLAAEWFAGGRVCLTAPLGYLDFLRLNSEARMVLTDSGGVQEETTILGVPCLTMRENTERPVTIEQGTNRLVGVEPAVILREARRTLSGEVPVPQSRPELWDGRASERIRLHLENALSERIPLAA